MVPPEYTYLRASWLGGRPTCSTNFQVDETGVELREKYPFIRLAEKRNDSNLGVLLNLYVLGLHEKTKFLKSRVLMCAILKI